MAASVSAVSVLTPNGRRQTVKVSPNTPLLQVLEDVCKKHGFNPDDHGLKFQRNVLDLTLQWRFAGLPNNAKLEVVVCVRQPAGAESAVRIALQMQDGSRLQGSFSSGQTLWDLLTHFPQTRCFDLFPSRRTSDLEPSGHTPVCVYMRDEVSGEEALKTTTLKSLGLTGGSAIIRYVLKGSSSSCPGATMDTVAMPTDDVATPTDAVATPTDAVVTPTDAVAKPTDAVAKMTVSQPPPPEPSASVPVETPAPPTQAAAPLNHHPVKQEEEEPNKSRERTVQPKTSEHQESQITKDDERPGTSQQCRDSAPSATPPQPHSPAPSATPTDFVPFSGSGQRLGGPAGLKSSTSWSPCVSGSPPKAKKPKPSHEIKRSVSAKQATRDEEEPDEYLEPIDREPLVFHLDSGARHHDDRELPDEFFEVTVDDIRKRFAQLKSERRAFEEAPLMTKSLRESQMKEKLDRYPKVALRVQFPDRQVLQGFFRPLETVAALRSFIRSLLQDQQLQFYLFVAPPKTILDDPNVTLFEANLFPAALVYFGSDLTTDCYLRSDLLDVSVSALQADELIAGCIPRSSPPLPSSAPGSCDSAPESCDSAPGSCDSSEAGCESQAPANRPVRNDPGKLPKWLKLTGKK
ncbi:tether containing UBX domain for GLUT4 isoform X1 [Rhinichthys klamathensis goyatoka]|uniref:tether containing UBX domain for GLUT4 isoform X1 n=1 Tax=Rhinichthys klamathensis goyatoka TaxID=3034132 RepID=UPI0024B58E6D|nr:tether containing UBX domain for GLUT4 isoform X1 [Rhinichthys klamathensis goyatoka]